MSPAAGSSSCLAKEHHRAAVWCYFWILVLQLPEACGMSHIWRSMSFYLCWVWYLSVSFGAPVQSCCLWTITFLFRPDFFPVLENLVFSRVFGTKDPNLSSCLEEFCYNTSVEALFSFCLREFHMAPLQSQQEQWAHIKYSGWAALSVVLRTRGCFQKGKAKRHVRVVGRGGVPPFDHPWPKSEPVSQERSISAQLSGCHILNF